jgi:hypothetical protein
MRANNVFRSSDRSNSLFIRAASLLRLDNSLFRRKNSVFDSVGNSLASRWRRVQKRRHHPTSGSIFTKFPVLFPVGREKNTETGPNGTASAATKSRFSDRSARTRKRHSGPLVCSARA